MSDNSDRWCAKDYAGHSDAQAIWAIELMDLLSLQGNESILDIGCGDGKITKMIADALPEGDATGIDYSKNMIDLASKTYRQNNLRFLRMDAANIVLDKKFDIAFSNAALHWVEDHPRVLSTLRPCLKNAAKILFQMGGYGNARMIIQTIARINGFQKWQAYFKGFKFPYYFYKVEDYEKWLPKYHFEVIKLNLIPKDMQHRDADGLKGWLKTTWFPFTDRVPKPLREEYLSQIMDLYLAQFPPDQDGKTHVDMVRLQVQAKAI